AGRHQTHPTSRRRASPESGRRRRLPLPAHARAGGRTSRARRRAVEARRHQPARRAPVAGADARRSPPLTGRGGDALFVPAAPLLDALTSTGADGEPRHVLLGDSPDRRVDISLCRDAGGRVLLAVAPPVVSDDGEPLRRLARQMAGERDTSLLLEILCNAGAEQAAGSGAGVLKAVANEGEVVAAIGGLAHARGR